MTPVVGHDAAFPPPGDPFEAALYHGGRNRQLNSYVQTMKILYRGEFPGDRVRQATFRRATP